MFKKLMDLASTFSFYSNGIKFGNDFISKIKELEVREGLISSPHEANTLDSEYGHLIKESGSYFKTMKSILVDDDITGKKKDFAFFLYSFKESAKLSRDIFKNEASLFFDNKYDQVSLNLFKILENGSEFSATDKLLESARESMEFIGLPNKRSWMFNKKLVLNLATQALLFKNLDKFSVNKRLDNQDEDFLELKGLMSQMYVEKMDKLFEVVLTRTVFEYLQGNFSEYEFFKRELFSNHMKSIDVVMDFEVKRTLFVPSKIISVMPEEIRVDFDKMYRNHLESLSIKQDFEVSERVRSNKV